MLSFRFSEDKIQSYDGAAILYQKRQSSKPIVTTNTPFHLLINALYPHAVHVHIRFPVANASPNGVALHLHQSVPPEQCVQLVNVEEVGERSVLSGIEIVLYPP